MITPKLYQRRIPANRKANVLLSKGPIEPGEVAGPEEGAELELEHVAVVGT